METLSKHALSLLFESYYQLDDPKHSVVLNEAITPDDDIEVQDVLGAGNKKVLVTYVGTALHSDDENYAFILKILSAVNLELSDVWMAPMPNSAPLKSLENKSIVHLHFADSESEYGAECFAWKSIATRKYLLCGSFDTLQSNVRSKRALWKELKQLSEYPILGNVS
ncbi:MAG: hypothetical protein ACI8ZN_001954 [Bacteroidia bacterium]|jgi:hypothetical protein